MAIQKISGSGQSLHKSFKTEIVLDELHGAIEWLESYTNRGASRTRFAQYPKILTEWKTGKRSLRDKDLLPILNATLDSFELIEIYQSLAGAELEGLSDKLVKYASGPILEMDEKSQNSSNLARNTGFELLMLARIRNCGLNAVLSPEADVIILQDRSYIAVECKRPQSVHKIARSISDAHKQLRLRRQETRPGTIFIGMVAISVGKSWHGADKFVLTNEHKASYDLLGEVLSRMWTNCEPNWDAEIHEDYSHLFLLYLPTFVLHGPDNKPVRADRTHLIQRDAYDSETAVFVHQFQLSLQGMLSWGQRR